MRRFGARGLGGTGRFHHADVGLNAVEDTPNGRASGRAFRGAARARRGRRAAVPGDGGRRLGRWSARGVGRAWATGDRRLADGRRMCRPAAGRCRASTAVPAPRRPARRCASGARGVEWFGLR
ncbi:hypothetical protein BURPS406E_B1019 [Burkholderia pseudomallei 406e]|nr:hypothetical protein BURPS406E_B1019 [Burkholderia pseudomallei 406e]